MCRRFRTLMWGNSEYISLFAHVGHRKRGLFRTEWGNSGHFSILHSSSLVYDLSIEICISLFLSLQINYSVYQKNTRSLFI